MSEQPHGPTQHHQPEKAGNPNAPKGMFSGKNKWLLIGGLGVVALLVFVFVRKSNSNASTSTTGTTSASLDPTTNAELQSALQNIASGGGGVFQPPAYTSPPSQNTGTTTTSSSPTSSVPSTPAAGSVSISIPNGALGWETAVFPSQSALDAWNAWNADFASTHGGRTQAYRSEWNTELSSLGAYNATGGPWNPPTQGTGNPNDAM
jgi:hypothetical protein